MDEASQLANRSVPGGDAFEEFLKSEYNNISQAHFNTNQSISEFFKVYIGIVSLPISVAVIFLKPEELQRSLRLLAGHSSLILFGFGFIVVVSLCVMGYIINLRCDAALYARTINGIRNYFYEKKLDIESENRYRVLPKSPLTPRYSEPLYFIFVVLAFAIVGTAYWTLGLLFFFAPTRYLFPAAQWRFLRLPGFWLALVACPLAHIMLYELIINYRERSYLRSRILGVDIDGVLNEHRTQFCRFLAQKVEKKFSPDAIVHIPVHEIVGAGITEADEEAVFNWPSYWVEMPPMESAPEILKKIRNQLGFKIWIFTHRGWPTPDRYPTGKEDEYATAWNRVWWKSRLYLAGPVRRFEKWCAERRIPEIVGSRPIRALTKQWLVLQKVRYDRLIVERGNTDTRDPRFNTRNRFIVSARKHIRAFVEDDLNKAKRLCDLCEVVFLIDQPYNQFEPAFIPPKNLIRVKQWSEIRDRLRTLF
ncbi:MAG: hypothetical protein ACLQDV_25455 [Candidatus Binataceae bacterium]